jgi:hypothetical protein
VRESVCAREGVREREPTGEPARECV